MLRPDDRDAGKMDYGDAGQMGKIVVQVGQQAEPTHGCLIHLEAGPHQAADEIHHNYLFHSLAGVVGRDGIHQLTFVWTRQAVIELHDADTVLLVFLFVQL